MNEGSPKQGETESTVTDRWYGGGATGMEVLNGGGGKKGEEERECREVQITPRAI